MSKQGVTTPKVRVFAIPDDAEDVETMIEKAVETVRKKGKFAILEKLTEIKFPNPQTETEMTTWPKGRVFSEDFELRWQQLEKKRICTFACFENSSLAEAIAQLGFEEPLSFDAVIEKIKNYYLWDENNARLGKKLVYACIPLPKNTDTMLPCLTVTEYRNAAGNLVFWRYMKMEYRS